MTPPDEIDAVLDELTLPWRRRESAWVVPASDRLPCEMVLTPTDTMPRVEATLLTVEELDEGVKQALDLFLERASQQVLHARCERTPTAVRVVGKEGSPLPAVVVAVRATARSLLREVAALTQPELAGVYRAFHS